MLKRFLSFYKPHLKLFILDMSVAFFTAILSVYFPVITRSLIKYYVPNKDMQGIYVSVLLLFLIIVFKTIFSYIRIRWGHILGVRMEYDMRSKMFRHLQKLSFTYYDNVKTGHIMSRISNDLNMIAEVAHHAPEDLIISVFVIFGAFFYMFKFNTQLAFISLIPLPILLFWGLKYGRRMKRGFRQVRRKIADLNSSVENSVQGIREVKSFTNEYLEIEKFQIVNNDFKMAKELMYKLMSLFHSGMYFLTDFYYLFVVAGGSYLIYKNKLDVIDLLTFTLYINFIMKPIDRLINFTEQFQQGATAFERFVEIIDIEPEIKDKKDAKFLYNAKGSIRIDNLYFKYSSSKLNILKNISLNVEAGENIAIVGESGAGKSTFVSLIPRFYEPVKGNIFIDDYNIMDLQQKCLRETIGIVQQNVFLFDTSIRDNVLYGKPEATEDELIAATKQANIYDFILSLPNGFDTYVGEHGVRLSGGQKQRISIARVFLKNPPILIFDEATSSLDAESEALIQDSMEKLKLNRTTITIAHRLSTVKNADRIYVLKNGEIVEEGKHQNLIDKKGYYFILYTKNLI